MTADPAVQMREVFVEDEVDRIRIPVRRATLEDVAREAGVSLATADRVVNQRDGVRAKTVESVRRAIAKLDYRANPAAARLARGQSFRFAFILPSSTNAFMAGLMQQVRRISDWLEPQNAFIDILQRDVFDPEALASGLSGLADHFHGVATVALDHPRVRAAIDDLVARGIPVVTLVSDAPTSRRTHYVGIDNPAAGRTSASLMGRFLGGRSGKVGVILGSMSLRDHVERLYGFQQVLSGEYPGLTLLPVLEERDQSERNQAAVARLLAQHPDLIGLYNVGAGNEGVVAALEAAGRPLVFIAHELTEATRRGLLSGTVAAVINQDPGHEARSAARVLMAEASGEPILPDQERIRIEIFLRDNMS
jgi:LacI family transcriptional regulator